MEERDEYKKEIEEKQTVIKNFNEAAQGKRQQSGPGETAERDEGTSKEREGGIGKEDRRTAQQLLAGKERVRKETK